MSEVQSSDLSVLLPQARVHVFSRDETTRNAILALKEDWRYARVELRAFDGGVVAAGERYEDVNSPDVLVVETEAIDESLADRIEGLAGNCDEGTSAIVVGPVNDVQLYRTLVGMGVSDYLVNPLNSVEMGDVIAKALLEKHGVSESQLVAFIGAKGGVGTSTMAINYAVSLAEGHQQKVFLLDACGGWSYLVRSMSDTEPSGSLAEAVKMVHRGDEDSFRRLTLSYSDDLKYLSTGAESLLSETASGEDYEMLLDYLMGTHPVVVCDLSGANSELQAVVLKKAAAIFALTKPTLSSLRSAGTLVKEIKAMRGEDDGIVSLIVNQRGFAGGSDVPKVDIEAGLGLDVTLDIDYMPKLFGTAEAKGMVACKFKENEKIWPDLVACTAHLFRNEKADKADQKKGGLSALLGKFKS